MNTILTYSCSRDDNREFKARYFKQGFGAKKRHAVAENFRREARTASLDKRRQLWPVIRQILTIDDRVAKDISDLLTVHAFCLNHERQQIIRSEWNNKTEKFRKDAIRAIRVSTNEKVHNFVLQSFEKGLLVHKRTMQAQLVEYFQNYLKEYVTAFKRNLYQTRQAVQPTKQLEIQLKKLCSQIDVYLEGMLEGVRMIYEEHPEQLQEGQFQVIYQDLVDLINRSL